MKKITLLLSSLFFCFYVHSQPMTMVPIQGGWFNPDGEEFEKKVYVSSFEMSAYETTIGQFQEFVREEYDSLDNLDKVLLDDGVFADPLGCIYEYFSADKQFPVFMVRYYSALKFCNWLSKKEGLKPVYTGIMEGRDFVEWDRTANGYRLPTKAEWMYAAGCANQNKRMYDNSIENLKEIANIQVKIDTIVEVVGQRLPNKWGLYDMIGNVREWCWDYAGTDNCKINPTGPAQGRVTNDYIDDGQTYDGTRDRIALGDDCQQNVKYIDITSVAEIPAFARVNYSLVGFRVVRNASEEKIFNNYINDNRVRCREMPGLNGRILGIFNKGDELEVIDEIRFNKTDKYNWFYVRMKSGFYGWVYGEYVSKRK